jgi:hypothetical protein
LHSDWFCFVIAAVGDFIHLRATRHGIVIVGLWILTAVPHAVLCVYGWGTVAHFWRLQDETATVIHTLRLQHAAVRTSA